MAAEWINDDNLNEVEDEDIDVDDTKLDTTDITTNDPDTATTTIDNLNNTNTTEKDTEVNDILSNLANFDNLISFEPLDSSTNPFDSKIDQDDDDIKTNNNQNNQDNKQLNIANKGNNKDNNNNKGSIRPAKEVKFEPLANRQLQGDRSYRSIRVPGPRMIHIRRLWKQICDPIVSQLKLQIRMNSKKNIIEIRTSKHTIINNAIQKGSDFIRACVLGFEIKDSIALIRMDDIYLESFDIRDVKFFNKKSDHWLRAVGRIAGQYGKIKYSIENSTNTRIVIFGFKIHILGSFTSIRLARNAVSRLVMGSSPGNVYSKLRVVSNRMKNRF